MLNLVVCKVTARFGNGKGETAVFQNTNGGNADSDAVNICDCGWFIVPSSER
jgi:hypothetical protein